MKRVFARSFAGANVHASTDQTVLRDAKQENFFATLDIFSELFRKVTKKLLSVIGEHFGSKFKRTKSLAQLSLANRPFAGSSHMVRNRLCWDANNAAGLQNKGTLTSLARISFVLKVPCPLFASHHNLFRTM